MKARVIATGKIVDVVANGNYYDTTDNKERYYSYELDFNDTADYWTRLEHKAAIAAMQGMIIHYGALDECGDLSILTSSCVNLAHSLVEKMKEAK